MVHVLLEEENNNRYLTEAIRLVSLQRLVKAKEIGDSIVYLASQLSSYVTGTSLGVDAGYTAQ